MTQRGRPAASAAAFDYGVLAAGVLAVSTAAVIIRGVEAPALVVAAYRLAFAALPLLAYAALPRHGRGGPRLGRRSSVSPPA